MAHKKCIICNEPILGEQGVPYKNRFAHQKCFNIAIKTLQKDKTEKVSEIVKKKTGKTPKPKAELKEALSEEEYKLKQGFYNYIRELTGNEELNIKIYAISEDYIKRFGFTFLSMHQTLIYLHEIIEKELTGDVVGIIPYYFSEAMQYYDSLNKVDKLNNDIDTTGMYKEKVVLIKPKPKTIKQIDIESVGKEVMDWQEDL